MKTINLTQTGGLPFKQYTLKKVQESYFELFFSMLNFLGINESVGKFILTGCQISGANITSGWMFIDGDLVSFAGAVGDGDTKFLKAITAESVTFKSGVDKPVYYTSAVQINAAGTKLSDFIRITQFGQLVLDPNYGTLLPTLIQRVLQLEKLTAPIASGFVVQLFLRPVIEIPVGWAEFTGLRGKGTIGWDPSDYDFDTVGDSIGSKTHTMTLEEMVPHDHESGSYGEGNTPILYPNIGLPSGFDDVFSKSKKSGGFDPGSGVKVARPMDIMNPNRIVVYIYFVV